MKFKIRKSLYLEIADDLREKITKGEYASGKQLPSEIELSLELGVSRGTLREALSVLEKEKIIYRIHGVGSFVQGAPIKVIEGIEKLEFDSSKAQTLYSLSNLILKLELIEATEKISRKLNIPEGSACYKVEIQVASDNIPIVYYYEIFPVWLFKNASQIATRKTFANSIEFMKKNSGEVLGQFVSSLKAVLPKARVMEVLSIDQSMPVIYIDGVLYNSGDKPLMYCKQYYRGDKYQFTLVRK